MPSLLGLQYLLQGTVLVLPTWSGWHFSLPYPMVRESWAGVLISWQDQLSLLFLFPSSPFPPPQLSALSHLSLLFLSLYACVSIHICPGKPPETTLWAVPLRHSSLRRGWRGQM